MCIAQKLEQVSHNGQKTHCHPREVNIYYNTAIIVYNIPAGRGDFLPPGAFFGIPIRNTTSVER
jgi:hypothetical protein